VHTAKVNETDGAYYADMGPLMHKRARKKVGYDKGAIVMLLLNLFAQLNDLLVYKHVKFHIMQITAEVYSIRTSRQHVSAKRWLTCTFTQI